MELKVGDWVLTNDSPLKFQVQKIDNRFSPDVSPLIWLDGIVGPKYRENEVTKDVEPVWIYPSNLCQLYKSNLKLKRVKNGKD